MTTTIIASDAEVRAWLAGATSFRRPVKPMRGEQARWCTPAFLAAVPSMRMCTLKDDLDKRWRGALGAQMEHPGGGPGGWIEAPWKPGDVLRVRECWAPVDFNICHEGGMERDDFTWCTEPGGIVGATPILYRATAPDFFEWNDTRESHWRSAATMPAWASRMSIRVTGVGIERVQDITEAGAVAEGVPTPTVRCDQPIAGDVQSRSFVTHPHVAAFAVAWDGRYASAGWASNPWAWVVNFERVEVV